MQMTKKEKVTHVELQSESGLSIKAYCEEMSIKYATFMNWRRRYKRNQEEPGGAQMPGKFIELTPPAQSRGNKAIEIGLPNGVRIKTDQRLDAALLKLLSDV